MPTMNRYRLTCELDMMMNASPFPRQAKPTTMSVAPNLCRSTRTSPGFRVCTSLLHSSKPAGRCRAAARCSTQRSRSLSEHRKGGLDAQCDETYMCVCCALSGVCKFVNSLEMIMMMEGMRRMYMLICARMMMNMGRNTDATSMICQY